MPILLVSSRRMLLSFPVLALFFIALGLSARAQTANTGAITGKITDPSGAVVPNAGISVMSVATGFTRHVVSDNAGQYEVPLLAPGEYAVTIEAQGFEKQIVPSTIVNVTATVVVNVQLKVGSTATSVRVSSEAPLLQTQSSALGKVTSNEQIVALPLANRNFTQILGLSTGVAAGVADAGEVGRNNQNVSANGADTTYNDFEFNGIDANNISENSASGFGPEVGLAVPAPDTIQEFKVQTGQYDASSGRSAGANIDIVSKSGSNNFHGTAWEFLRNDSLNANDFFLNANGQPRPVLKQNQFGLAVGGPIRKNRTYFFLAYQGTIQRNGVSPSLSLESAVLPPLTNDRSAATLGAEFAGQSGAFGGTAVASDGSNINPVALALLSFKFPNGQFAIPTPQRIVNGLGQFTFSGPAHFEENQYTLNIDHAISERNELSGRFFFSVDPQSSVFALAGANLPGWGQNETDKNVLFTLSDTHAFSSNWINVARVGFVRFRGARTVNEPITNSDVGITSPEGLPGIPTFAINGLFTIGTPASPDFFESTNMFEGGDTVSFLHGKHTFRMGADVKRNQLNVNLPFLTRGSLFFFSFPDFLLGQSGVQNGSGISNIFSSTVYDGDFDKGDRFIDFSSFGQDDYKMTQRLTLNLGLRYDFFGPPSEVFGRFASFDPRFADPNPPPEGTFTGLVMPANYNGVLPPGVVKADTNGLYSRSFKNFAPRFGFAYQLFNKPALVLRGGYGIYYQRESGQWPLQTITNLPFVLAFSQAGTGNSAATEQVPINPPVPAPSTFPQFVPRFQNSSVTYEGIERSFKTPYTQQYSLNIQDEFAPGFLWEVGYVGTKSTHLPVCINWNQSELASTQNPVHGITTNTINNSIQREPILGVSPFASQCRTELRSNYNSLQTSVEKRFGHGVTFLASYTFSRDLANNSGNGNVDSLVLAGITGDQTNIRQSYGPANFNRPQRLVVSFVYQTPKSRWGPRPLQLAASDWEFSGVMVFQSGLPITVIDSNAGSAFGPTAQGLSRAQCTGMSAATSGSVESRLNDWLNAAAFTGAPVIGSDGMATAYGDCGAGLLRGPDERNLDIGFARYFKITEGTRLQFRTEFFNFTNTPKFGLPISDRAAGAAFGLITSSVSNPRIVQFALKFLF